jgi:hypothetical protein
MSTPESKVKLFIDNYMKANFPSAFKYSPPGIGRFGKNGMPDRIWWVPAADQVCITVMIEAKAEGNKATQLQLNTLTKLAMLGVVVAVVIGKDQEKMERIKNEILRRISVANGESRPYSIPTSEDNYRVPPTV